MKNLWTLLTAGLCLSWYSGNLLAEPPRLASPYRAVYTAPQSGASAEIAWPGAVAGSQEIVQVSWPWRRSGHDQCPDVIVPAHPEVRPPEAKEPKAEPKAPVPPAAQPPMTDAFTEAPPAGTAAPSGFNPHMIGDSLPVFTCVVLPPASSTATPTATCGVPLPGRVFFKIADGESPRPVTRVFLNYNYFNELGRGFPLAPRSDLHAEIIGFEYAFLDGNASIGMRFPTFQQDSDDGIGFSDFGDISTIFKWALINNRDTGNVFSIGMVVTAPTGPTFLLADGSQLNSTLLQPWAGFIYNIGRGYLHGFSSAVVPTNSQDVTLLFNDIGLGFRAYNNNDGLQIIPTVELHVTTPLNNRNRTNSLVFAPDIFAITGGVHLQYGRAILTIGTSTPLTGPKPYAVEGIAQLNLRF